MKLHEYLTYAIIAFIVVDLAYRLVSHDWGNIGLSITALIGWFYVQGYERQERQERMTRDRDQFTV